MTPHEGVEGCSLQYRHRSLLELEGGRRPVIFPFARFHCLHFKEKFFKCNRTAWHRNVKYGQENQELLWSSLETTVLQTSVMLHNCSWYIQRRMFVCSRSVAFVQDDSFLGMQMWSLVRPGWRCFLGISPPLGIQAWFHCSLVALLQCVQLFLYFLYKIHLQRGIPEPKGFSVFRACMHNHKSDSTLQYQQHMEIHQV